MYAEPTPWSPPASVPGQPTDALPGSERKIRAMIERATRRESLFHPMDGLCPSSPAQPPADLWVPADAPPDEDEELGLTA